MFTTHAWFASNPAIRIVRQPSFLSLSSQWFWFFVLSSYRPVVRSRVIHAARTINVIHWYKIAVGISIDRAPFMTFARPNHVTLRAWKSPSTCRQRTRGRLRKRRLFFKKKKSKRKSCCAHDVNFGPRRPGARRRAYLNWENSRVRITQRKEHMHILFAGNRRARTVYLRMKINGGVVRDKRRWCCTSRRPLL